MQLRDALQFVHGSKGKGKPPRVVQLASGFAPLHLQTLLHAHVQVRNPDYAITVRTGIFEDLAGTISSFTREVGDSCLVAIEWPDLDLRLGYRHSGGWKPGLLDDILAESAKKMEALAANIVKLADSRILAVSLPTLPLVPISYTHPAQASLFELRMRAALNSFLLSVAGHSNVRVINQDRLLLMSPLSTRLDLQLEQLAGFPYRIPHADALAQLAAGALYPAAPKKGLITDLDETLWAGILGEDGVERVSWSLEERTQLHGLYQQILAALAESGVLIAVASRNDPELVLKAISRPDFLLPPKYLFPLHVHWGEKSESIARILKTWNVASDSVVFVDDSPMELAEVQARFPAMECLRFDSTDAAGSLRLFWKLRELFGKPALHDEDFIRAASVRNAVVDRPVATAVSSAFLSNIGSKINIDYRRDINEARAFELVNKTNQFNLNGRRYSEAQWRMALENPNAFLAVVAYEDKFGALGRIAAVVGEANDGTARIHSWVMSCRAFGRHIEYQTLRHLFDRLKASEIHLSYSPTERNGPFQEFLASIDSAGEGDIVIPEDKFRRYCPMLFHEMKETG